MVARRALWALVWVARQHFAVALLLPHAPAVAPALAPERAAGAESADSRPLSLVERPALTALALLRSSVRLAQAPEERSAREDVPAAHARADDGAEHVARGEAWAKRKQEALAGDAPTDAPADAAPEAARDAGAAAAERSLEETERYCSGGKHQDPICSVQHDVSALGDEVAQVYAHIFEMFAEKHAGDEPAPESVPDSEAEREELTEEEVQAERTDVTAPAKPTKGVAMEADDLLEKVQEEYPESGAAFRIADTDRDGRLSAAEFAAQCAQVGAANGEELFHSLFGAQGALTEQQYTRGFGNKTLDEAKDALVGDDRGQTADDAWAPRKLEDQMSLKDFEALCARAEPPVGRWNAQRVLSQADHNHDGSLSCAEFMQAFGVSLKALEEKVKDSGGAVAAFKAADVDRKGDVSKIEFSNMVTTMAKPGPVNTEVLFRGVDADASGALTEGEYVAALGESALDAAQLKALLVERGPWDEHWLDLCAGRDEVGPEEWAKWLATTYGVSNGRALYAQLWPDGKAVSHQRFRRAFGAEVTWELLAEKLESSGKDLEEIFQQADADGSQVLEEAEFEHWCASLGVSELSARDLLGPLDAEGLTRADFAHRLGLERQEKLERAAPEVRELSERIHKLKEVVDAAKAQKQQLEEQGKLDVALEQELDHVIAQAAAFEQVADELLDAKLDGQEHKVPQLAHQLQQEKRHVESEEEEFGQLVPQGDKWWRYGYEYAFVEASLMAVVVGLVGVVDLALLRTHARAWGTVTHASLQKALYMAAGITLATVCATAVVLIGLVRWTGGQYALMLLRSLHTNERQLNLPKKGPEYEAMALEVYMYLVLTVMLYYLSIPLLISACKEKTDHWHKLEEESAKLSTPRGGSQVVKADGTAVHPDTVAQAKEASRTGLFSAFSLHRAPTMFDGYVYKFFLIKNHMLSHLMDTASDSDPSHRTLKHALEDKCESVEAFKEHFSLALYFEHVVHEVVMWLMDFDFFCWVRLLIVYMGVALLAGHANTTYLGLMIVVGVCSLVTLIGMFVLVRNREAILMDLGDDEEVQKPACRIFTTRFVMESMRLSTFFLIFGTIQFVCSPFCWKYHFYATIAFCVALALVVVAWVKLWVYIIPCFAAAMAMPPLYAPSRIDRLADHLIAAAPGLKDRPAA